MTETTWPTEHVLVSRIGGGKVADIETLILKTIERKQNKGADKRLPETLYFEEMWVVSLQSVNEGEYTYGVTLLNLSDGNAPTWRVRIGKDFDVWQVGAIQ